MNPRINNRNNTLALKGLSNPLSKRYNTSMNWFNESLIWGICSAFALLVIVLFIWLIREHFKFKKELQVLSGYASRNDRDITGLCSAAITIDERLTAYEVILKELQTKATEIKPAESAEQPYRNAIQKVQSGANVAELMQNFGLSRDEATLLIRLHGHKSEYN